MSARNGSRHSGGATSRKSPAPPRSTLASLLSSQRRSAVQSDRYRVQQARPFADSTHIDQEVEDRVVQNLKSPRENGRGNNSHQALIKGSRCNRASTASSDRGSIDPHMHDLKEEPSSRRVRFNSSSESNPMNSEERPQRKSRWDVRSPSVQSTLSHKGEATFDASQQQQKKKHYAVKIARNLPRNKPISPPPYTAIPKKGGRSEGKANDIQQKFIPNYSTSTPHATEKVRDGQSDETKCPRSYLNYSAARTSHTSEGNTHSYRNSRRDESISQTTTLQYISADTPKAKNEVKKTRNNESMLLMNNEKMPKNVILEVKASGKNMQYKSDKKFHDSFIKISMSNDKIAEPQEVSPMKSHKSTIKRRRKKTPEQDLPLNRETSVLLEGSAKLKQNEESQHSSIEPSMVKDNRPPLDKSLRKKPLKSEKKRKKSKGRDHGSRPKGESLVPSEGIISLRVPSAEQTIIEDKESTPQSIMLKPLKSERKRRKNKETKHSILERESPVSNKEGPRVNRDKDRHDATEPSLVKLEQDEAPNRETSVLLVENVSFKQEKSQDSLLGVMMANDGKSPLENSPPTKPRKSKKKRRKSKEREQDSIPKGESSILREDSLSPHDPSTEGTTMEDKAPASQSTMSKSEMKPRKSKKKRRRSKEREQDSISEGKSSVSREGIPSLHDPSTAPTMMEDKETAPRIALPKSLKSERKRRKIKETKQHFVQEQESLVSKEESPRINAKAERELSLKRESSVFLEWDATSMQDEKSQHLSKGPMMAKANKSPLLNSLLTKPRKSKKKRRRSKEREQESVSGGESSVLRECIPSLRDSSTGPTLTKDKETSSQSTVPKSLKSERNQRKRDETKHSILERESPVKEESPRVKRHKNQYERLEPLMAEGKKLGLQKTAPTKSQTEPQPENEVSEEGRRRLKKHRRGENVRYPSTESTTTKERNSSPKVNENTKQEPSKQEIAATEEDSFELKEGEEEHLTPIDPKMVKDESLDLQKNDPTKSPQSKVEPSSSQAMHQAILKLTSASSKESSQGSMERSDDSIATIAKDKNSAFQKASSMKSPKLSEPEPLKSKLMQQDSILNQETSVPKNAALMVEEVSCDRDKVAEDILKGGSTGVSTKPEVVPTSPAPKSILRDDGAISFSKKKRNKECSPFRIKVGCIVAVRFRKIADGGNSEIVPVVKDSVAFRANKSSIETDAPKQLEVKDQNEMMPADASRVATDSSKIKESSTKDKTSTKRVPRHYEVWSDPIPGRDDGTSLLGSWIRCVFPKSTIANWQKSNKNRNPISPGRILEGNVISILGNNRDSQRGITVSVLVDRASIKSLPYLRVVLDDSSEAVSSIKQKRRKLEAKIRGENKAVVTITLASVFDRRNGSKLDTGVVSQWVIRKRVSAKPAGKKPSKSEMNRNKQHAHSLFVGDGIDKQSQQEQNWRWIASRAACQLTGTSAGHFSPGNNLQDSVSQLVGEVIKMDVSPKETLNGLTTLAMVTIKRLWTPEQTSSGRLPHHRPLELFDPGHENSDEMCFEAPIEQLIVIGKCANRVFHVPKQLNGGFCSGDGHEWNFNITHSYHCGDSTYMPLRGDVTAKMSVKTCHYCQRLCYDSQLVKTESQHGNEICVQCLQLVESSTLLVDDETRTRDKSIEPSTNLVSYAMQDGIGQGFLDLVASLHSTSPVDFTLPSGIGQLTLQPSFLPITGDAKSRSYTKMRSKDSGKLHLKHGKRKKRALPSDAGPKSRNKLKDGPPADTKEDGEHDSFKPGCCRAVSFDQINKNSWGASKLKLSTDHAKQPFFREKNRARAIKIGKTEEKTILSGRAARANQRRMFKSLSALGDGTNKVDRLAGRDREQQLRFDKSQIHGWGVYAEQPINAGDMIIEYRGEIIGNAVADKRELEYQRAKLDDYMFRIDAYIVCDATILGNVARYINSSCSPNCYTQIITAGENKRIVIYAKKDIRIGEELCYDYKFSLEYDPAKRIVCHCNSPECRGFMNWDKKYA